MGNNIGYSHENGIKLFLHPEVQPNPLEEPTFDPNLGFSNGRKERGRCVYVTIKFEGYIKNI